LMQNRGKVLPGTLPGADRIVATIHPSSVLRAPDAEGRREAFEMLVGDLKVVAKALKKA
jgi:uracil-DNA glycosylase